MAGIQVALYTSEFRATTGLNEPLGPVTFMMERHRNCIIHDDIRTIKHDKLPHFPLLFFLLDPFYFVVLKPNKMPLRKMKLFVVNGQ